MKLTEITGDHTEPLLISMLRKLQPTIKSGKMDYAEPLSRGRTKLITRLEIDEGTIELGVMQDDGQVWAASIPSSMVDDFTIKTYRSYGEKRWVLIKKSLADQVRDLPEPSEG